MEEWQKKLEKREEAVEKVLGELEKKKEVTIRVGNKVYFTHQDVLTKKEDSFFHGLFNPKFQQGDENGCYNISRDGEVFQYVLEYLIYDDILSEIKDEGTLKKLIKDADFYQLKELKGIAEKILETFSVKKVNQMVPSQSLAKWQSNSGSNGTYFNWNKVIINPDPIFYQCNGQTITVLQKGTF